MLKMRMDLLNIKLELETILTEFSKDIKTIDKIRNSDYLSDKMNSSRSSVGFNSGSDDDDDDDDDDDEEFPNIETNTSRRRPRAKRLTKEDASDLVIKGGIFEGDD
jgi:hypothetical protein